MTDRLSLTDLANAAGVTPRTVRYYIAEGLLRSPERGPGAKYDREQLDRLRLIRKLQRGHLPLAEIRRRLHQLDDEQVRQLLHAPGDVAGDAPAGSGALGYVRAVLAGSVAGSMSPSAPPAAQRTPAQWAARAAPGRAESRPPAYGADRSHWERVVLSPDVELHIRRPLTRHQNRAVSRLIDHAHQLLEEDQP